MDFVRRVAGDIHLVLIDKSEVLRLRACADGNFPDNRTPLQVDNEDVIAKSVGNVSEMPPNEDIARHIAERNDFVLNGASLVLLREIDEGK